MGEELLLPGRSYWLKIGATTVIASVNELKHEVNVNTLERRAAKTLSLNGIGVATLSTDRPLPFTPYAENRSEEHTSELQSLMRISYAVFCLKKKKNTKNQYIEAT